MKRNRLFRFKPFSPKQLHVLNWWMPESRYSDRNGIIADGAIRSGKTLSMSLSFVIWAMTTFDGQDLIMAGKTVGSFRRNVLDTLLPMLGSRGYTVNYRRTDNLMIVSRGKATNYFYIFGGKDEASQDLIQGLTAAGAFFDEVALMPESFVNQATARCSVDGSKWWFNCNPAGPYHWFKQNWIDKRKQKELVYLHFTMDDNLSLSEKIKSRFRSQYSGVFFKRYILGMWVMAEGVIYDMFDPEAHVFHGGAPLPEIPQYYVSCDYGTQNATVYLLWAKGTDGIWYCLREYYYSGRDESQQKTDSEYADDLAHWLGGIKPVRIVVDPAAASFIAELKKRGYAVKKAKNDVLDGIRYVSSLLSDNKIRIHDVCDNLIREFASYVWDEKAADRGEDKPVKQFDHALDALRYHCMTIIRRPNGGMSILK